MTTEDRSVPGTMSSRRRDVLRALKDATGPSTIAGIADRLGMHPNTVRFQLDALVRHGQVERVEPERRSPGRPPQLFQAVRGMDPTGPRRYQVLARVLADDLATDPDPRRRAIAAGRAWGRRQALAAGPDRAHSPRESVDRLVTMLDGLGFAPEPRGDGAASEPRGDSAASEIELRHCPFLELTETRSQVVCPIHLGVMQGAMEAWQSPVRVDRLDPFVEPDRCVARLTATLTLDPARNVPG